MLEKDYCDYDTCVALWNMGLIPHPYDNTDMDKVMAIITLYEAQKWLREEKNLHIEVRWYSNLWYEYEVKEAEGKRLVEGSAFKTYEEALSTAIYMATEHLKEE